MVAFIVACALSSLVGMAVVVRVGGNATTVNLPILTSTTVAECYCYCYYGDSGYGD